MSNSQKINVSRPSTPDISQQAANKLFLNTPQQSPRRSHQNYSDKLKKSVAVTSSINQTPAKKIGLPAVSTNKPIMIQSKEGPQILATLKEIQNTVGILHSKLTAQDIKIEKNAQCLQSLWEVVRTIHTTPSGMEFEKPAFIPFTAYKEIKNYDKSSETEQVKLRKWLNLHRIGTNVAETVREIFSKGRLMTDELLTLVVWEGTNGRKTSKNQLFRRRITHDLRPLLDMYPSMTDSEFKLAVQKALKSANSREDQRKRSKAKSGQLEKKRKLSDTEFFNSKYVPSVESEEEEEEERKKEEGKENRKKEEINSEDEDI
ncbi:uncharacterized protein LOC141527314 isoform X2 [Cotesia typhae]|uniref:uncharacterized protein LOC141527314 isoform X2 n=1 Tax=Cotesia typhae TaxID=2053667 RepID=UPI003D683224